MDLVAHFRVMWRRRWRILFRSLVIAAWVFALSASRPHVYRADAMLSVNSGTAAAGDARSREEALFLAGTFAKLAGTRAVVADAVRRSALPISTDTALGRVHVATDPDVGFLSISAKGPSPRVARALDEGLTQALVAAVESQESEKLTAALLPIRGQIATLEATLAGLGKDAPERAAVQARYTSLLESAAAREVRPADSLAVVSSPEAADGPISPAPLRAALLALVAALVVNAELAVVLEALSDRFSSENQQEEVAQATGLPVLAEVPTGEDDEVIEAFRTLRTNLSLMGSPGLRSVAVVSAEPGVGKSFCALNLALVAADLDGAVTLVDGDLRSPTLHEWLEIERTPGLTDALLAAEADSALVHPRHYPQLNVLPAGSPVDDPGGLLGGGFLRDVLAAAKGEMVVVDTPAEAFFADALTVSLTCDVTVVVMDAATTRRRALRRLIAALQRVNANPLGVVINGTRPSSYLRRARDSSQRHAVTTSRGGIRWLRQFRRAHEQRPQPTPHAQPSEGADIGETG